MNPTAVYVTFDDTAMSFKITGSHTTPLVYKPVFDIWFFDERYQHWKTNKEATWQLRCIGGPGSGKVSFRLFPFDAFFRSLTYLQTQFSSLVVQDLQNEYKGNNVAIVSIFFNVAEKCSKTPYTAVTTTFLTEVEHQLENLLPNSHKENLALYRNPIDANLTKSKIYLESDDETRQRIATKRSSFERAFIIVDDLDIVRQYPKEYSQLRKSL